MNPIAIEFTHVSKDYGKGRGIFDISFTVPQGAVFGYCGTNGSGKTTTIRHMMGFIRQDKGEVKIMGKDAWKDSESLKGLIGYVPGEIAFPDVPTGSEFLKGQAKMIGMEDFSFAERIIKSLQLDPTANLKRMSKGMKQKTALVAAFMNEPDILILDEPTTGLDPLMRASFVSLLLEEKAKGRTIFMSSHMFEELEKTCDYVGLIKDGHLLEVVDMKALKDSETSYYFLSFINKKDFDSFALPNVKTIYKDTNKLIITVSLNKSRIPSFLGEVKKIPLSSFESRDYTLESRFEELIGKKEGLL